MGLCTTFHADCFALYGDQEFSRTNRCNRAAKSGVFKWMINRRRRLIGAVTREEQPLTHFDDLAEFDYFGIEDSHALRAVGWLTNDRAFTTGRMDEEVFAKLKELLVDPWQPSVSCGVHHCELCQYDPPCGNANLFVPNGSTIFVCPELIVHYIAAHHYRPPDEFLAAVSCCPKTRTMQYKKLLLESGGRTLVPKMG